MIPKIIHYVWLGNQEKPKSVRKCISTWKQKFPDFRFIEWNDQNSPLSDNQFVKQAYRDKMWAFVSDYVRVAALYKYGGIYLDTDVTAIKDITPLLEARFFSGFESKGLPFSGAVFGAEKHHPFIKRLIKFYETTSFDSKKTDSYINTRIASKMLVDIYHCDKTDCEQVLDDGIHIYDSNVLCNPSSKSILIHIRNGSWVANAKIITRIGIKLRSSIHTRKQAIIYADVKRIQQRIKKLNR